VSARPALGDAPQQKGAILPGLSIDRQWAEQHLALLDAPIPAEVKAMLGLLVADTWAIAEHARRHRIGGTQFDHVLVSTPGPCRVWGDHRRVAAPDATCLNACRWIFRKS